MHLQDVYDSAEQTTLCFLFWILSLNAHKKAYLKKNMSAEVKITVLSPTAGSGTYDKKYFQLFISYFTLKLR